MGRSDKPNVLIIIDMQNDFIDGSLANPDAQAIVDPICRHIEYNRSYYDRIICTRDNHRDDYLETPEGIKLPVEHCIRGTTGWCLNDKIYKAIRKADIPYEYVDKSTFGFNGWECFGDFQGLLDSANITIVGTCTDVCVVSNALLLKTFYPKANIKVFGNLCAGVTKERHTAALEVMDSCQIEVINYGVAAD